MFGFTYFLKRALGHLRRSPGVTSVTIGTIALVFFIIGVFLLLAHNLVSLGNKLATGLRLVVFLEERCSQEQKEALHDFLSYYPASDRIQFVDRDQATSKFRDRLGDQAYLLDGLDENPLPESFEVTFTPAGRAPEKIGALADQVAILPGVEEVQYGKAWLSSFFEFNKAARGLGWLVGVLVFLVALLIVSNTIRLSVYARQEEISILKLVGATNGFIRGPFYVEGMVLGTLGAFLGMIMTYLMFMMLVPGLVIPTWMGSKMMSLDFLPLAQAAWMVAAGTLLGLIGTCTSVWRYLKKL